MRCRAADEVCFVYVFHTPASEPTSAVPNRAVVESRRSNAGTLVYSMPCRRVIACRCQQDISVNSWQGEAILTIPRLTCDSRSLSVSYEHLLSLARRLGEVVGGHYRTICCMRPK